MSSYSKQNKRHQCILTVIDVLSKCERIILLKHQRVLTVPEKFKFKDRKPEHLWLDKGKEFHKKVVKSLF
jgi:hypothetical protein